MPYYKQSVPARLPWLPARLQFAVSEDLLLLEVARQATQQVKPGALPPALGGGSPGGASPLLVTKGEVGAVAAGCWCPHHRLYWTALLYASRSQPVTDT